MLCCVTCSSATSSNKFHQIHTNEQQNSLDLSTKVNAQRWPEEATKTSSKAHNNDQLHTARNCVAVVKPCRKCKHTAVSGLSDIGVGWQLNRAVEIATDSPTVWSAGLAAAMCKNSWTDRVPAPVETWRSKEHCIRWGSDPPKVKWMGTGEKCCPLYMNIARSQCDRHQTSLVSCY